MPHCPPASPGTRRFSRTPKIAPPLYMILFGALMWALDRWAPLAVWLTPPWTRLGWIVAALSFIPAAGAFQLFHRFHTTANPFHPENASHLVTGGVYRYSRNPMYLALLMLLCGWAIVLGSVAPLAAPPLFAAVLTWGQIAREERALEQHFGDAYRDYRARVRRWL